jgi:hypothetical protein
MNSCILMALGLIVTLAGGIVHGRLANRWGPPADLEHVADRLASLPEELGDWRLVAAEEMSPGAARQLECAGHLIRTYAHRQTGANVKLALIAGPPGPIAVHTPEVCYRTRDWKREGTREAQTIEAEGVDPHTFWAVTMQGNDAVGDRLRVYYAWTDSNQWQASRSPRYEFARSPYLIKLQLAGEIPFSASPNDDPCRDFLSALVNSGWNVSAIGADEEREGNG